MVIGSHFLDRGTMRLLGAFFSPVYMITFSCHIRLASYQTGLVFTLDRFFILDLPPVYMKMYQSDALYTVYACKETTDGKVHVESIFKSDCNLSSGMK